MLPHNLVSYALDQFPSQRHRELKDKEGLLFAQNFLVQLDNPQESYRSIHIAGTSGKGSVALYLSHLLKEHGFCVGTHLSPHVNDIRERAMINCQLPNTKDFKKYIRKVTAAATQPPPFILGMTAVAFELFRDKKVDYSVIETGIGGMYDYTNTIKRSDKLAVITRLGLDHSDVLGNSATNIAWHKAGIIAKGGEVIYLSQDTEANRVIYQTAQEKHARLTVLQQSVKNTNVSKQKGVLQFDYTSDLLTLKNIQLPTLALYQVENAALALRALEALSKRDGFKLSKGSIRTAFEKAYLPGRFEIHNYGRHRIIFDGAHNPQKLAALVDSLKALHETHKPLWVVGFKSSKDIAASLKAISTFNDGVLCCGFRDGQNSMSGHFGADPKEVAKRAEQANIVCKGALDNPAQALQYALTLAKPKQPIAVSGSFYILTDAKKALTDGTIT